MRIIEKNAHGTEFAVWLNKEEKELLETMENIRKVNSLNYDRNALAKAITDYLMKEKDNV